MENPIKMDDLGVPLFSETPRSPSTHHQCGCIFVCFCPTHLKKIGDSVGGGVGNAKPVIYKINWVLTTTPYKLVYKSPSLAGYKPNLLSKRSYFCQYLMANLATGRFAQQVCPKVEEELACKIGYSKYEALGPRRQKQYLCGEETFSVARGLYRDPSIIVGISQSFTFEEIEVQFSLLAQSLDCWKTVSVPTPSGKRWQSPPTPMVHSKPPFGSCTIVLGKLWRPQPRSS